jgi:hypothetical protein
MGLAGGSLVINSLAAIARIGPRPPGLAVNPFFLVFKLLITRLRLPRRSLKFDVDSPLLVSRERKGGVKIPLGFAALALSSQPEVWAHDGEILQISR